MDIRLVQSMQDGVWTTSDGILWDARNVPYNQTIMNMMPSVSGTLMVVSRSMENQVWYSVQGN